MLPRDLGQQGRRGVRIFEQAQGRFQHRSLARGIVRPPERITVGEGDEQATRRAHGLGNLPQELEGDRRDPLSFELG